MATKRSDRIEIDVPLNGLIVKQLCIVEDWSFTTGSAVNGESEFRIRHFRPLASMRRGVLRVLVDDLMTRASTNAAACRQLAAHVRGLYLNPDTVLNHRALTERDLGNALRETTLASITHVAKFEALVSSYARKIEVHADLDRQLVVAITRLPFDVAAAQAHQPLLLKSVAERHNDLFAKLRRENTRAGAKPSKTESHGRRVIRQMLLDHMPDDKLASRVSAFRYSCEGDALVERANRIVLDALCDQLKLSVAEVRLFEQLYLRWQPSPGPLVFEGIFGHRPFLMSLLRFSPNTVAYLVLARCWDLPLELRSAMEHDFKIQLIAALRAAEYVIHESRDIERTKRYARRSAFLDAASTAEAGSKSVMELDSDPATMDESPGGGGSDALGATSDMDPTSDAEVTSDMATSDLPEAILNVLGTQRAVIEAAPPSELHRKASEVVANLTVVTLHQLKMCQALVEAASLTDAARELGIPYQVVQNAVRRGWERVTKPHTAPTPRGPTEPPPTRVDELSARPPIGGSDAQYIAAAVIRRRPKHTDTAPLGGHRNPGAAL